MTRKTIVAYCRFGHVTGAEAAISMRFSAAPPRRSTPPSAPSVEPDTGDLLPELKATVRAADRKSSGELTPRPWRKRRA
jgi:hypothetical protein